MVRIAVLASLVVAAAAGSAAHAAEIIQVPDQPVAEQAVSPPDPLLLDAGYRSQEAQPFFRWFWQQPEPAPYRRYAPRQRRAPEPQEADRQVPNKREYSGRKRSRGYQSRIARLLRQPATAAKGPVLIMVSLAKQKLTVYDSGMRVTESPISSGMPGHPTPMGVFTVLERQSWHTSNLYSDAPMPLMQRLTWSGIALHAGVLPGYPASHGCIRLPESFALRLWHTTRVGARVVVSRDDAKLSYITHPLLPQPRVPLPTAAPGRPDVAPPQESAPAAVSMFVPPPGDDADAERDYLMTASDEEDDGADEVAEVAEGPRLQYAFSVSDATDFEPSLVALRHRMKKHRYVPRDPEVQYSEVYGRASTGLSVFISRRDQRLYVRRGFQPVFDEPVTIASPERPLGTHVFTAVSESEGGSRLDWTVVSPTGGERSATPDAEHALDRIQLSAETRDRLEKLAGVGASLIISDAGLGATAAIPDADFTVVLR